jgi:hypothetical protein
MDRASSYPCRYHALLAYRRVSPRVRPNPHPMCILSNPQPGIFQHPSYPPDWHRLPNFGSSSQIGPTAPSTRRRQNHQSKHLVLCDSFLPWLDTRMPFPSAWALTRGKRNDCNPHLHKLLLGCEVPSTKHMAKALAHKKLHPSDARP